MASFILPDGGLDTFYIDESAGDGFFVIVAVRVPMLRPVDDALHVVWPDYYEAATKWRREVSKEHHLLFRKELHAQAVLTGKVQIHKQHRILRPTEAVEAVSFALKTATFLPPASVLIAAATNKTKLFGQTKMQAALYALLQRMERQTTAERVAAMTFFDEGHNEYGVLYRQAKAYLPAGSSQGGWPEGSTQNFALARFIEDGNMKSSKGSYPIQLADLIAYSVLQKLKAEAGLLSDRRLALGHDKLFDSLPQEMVNTKATRKRRDGIVVL